MEAHQQVPTTPSSARSDRYSCCCCLLCAAAVFSLSVSRCAGGDSDSFRVFVEDLKEDDHELVMATAARLPAVAALIGQARTRNELIPFLLDWVEQDADEAHTSIANQIGDFTEVRTTSTPAHERQHPPN